MPATRPAEALTGARRMADLDILDVRLYDRSVGTLTRLGRERIVFGFDPAHADDPERAALSLSFKGPFGRLVTDIEPTRIHAPPFFSNLLPEGSLREFLARSAGIDPRLEFLLLATLGEDLPGAVTIAPIGGEWPGPSGVGRLNRRKRELAGRSAGGRGTPDSMVRPLFRSPPPVPRPAAPLRYSLAGTQLKVPAVMSGGRPSVPRHGIGGTWIVKLPTPGFPGLPEQEHWVMRLAASVGIEVAETRLVPVDAVDGLPLGMGEGPGNALAVRRFDRLDDGTRLHTEDFAQILGVEPGEKYKGATYRALAEIIGREMGDEAVTEFVRRLVFCALIGNGDAHLKNWSVIYPDGRTPRLAPAYDLVSTVAYAPEGGRMALDWVSGTAGFKDLSDGLMARLASGARLARQPVVRTARETVARFRDVWGAAKARGDVPGEVVGGAGGVGGSHGGSLPIG